MVLSSKESTSVLAIPVCLLLVVCIHSNAQAQMTRKEAVAVLMEQVIEPTEDKEYLWAYGPQDMLVTGDVVRPKFNTQSYPGKLFTIDRPTWFFYINDDITSKYSHPTRFVYIDANHANPTGGDGITIVIQGWWPVINGKEYYGTSDAGKDDLVYGSRFGARFPGIGPCSNKTSVNK